MRPVVVVLLVLVNFYCFSQTNERLWEEGKLTWVDFQAEPLSSEAYDSELSYQLSYSTGREKVADTVLIKFTTKNFINPKNSWVKESKKTDRLLRYNQVLFDILEIHRRELQYDLHRIDDIYKAERIFSQHNENLNDDLRLFRTSTKTGSDVTALDEWELKVNEQLENSQLDVVPDFTDKDFGIGVHLGFGSGILSGSIKNSFTPTFNITYGFEFAYKKSLLLLNASLASNRVKSEFNESQLTWEEGIRTNIAILDASIGYTIIDNSKHKVTPFAGIGVFEVTVADNEGENYTDHRITSSGLVYGISYDFKILKAIRFTPSPFYNGYRERAEHNFRLRLYVSHPNFDNMRGTSFNLTLGYSLFSRIIKVNK